MYATGISISTHFAIALEASYEGRRTHSQHKLIVRLVVDFIQNVKHLDGVVRYGAQVVIDRLLGLKRTSARSG